MAQTLKTGEVEAPVEEQADCYPDLSTTLSDEAFRRFLEEPQEPTPALKALFAGGWARGGPRPG